MNAISARSLQQCVRELYVFLRSGRWDGAQPRHFAALHGWCHKRVFGSWPFGYDGKDFSTAALRAGRLMRDAFFGDPYDMADYVKWNWLAERARVAKGVKERAKRGSRLSDELLFLPSRCLSDYRKALIKRAKEVERSMQ